MNKSTYKMGFKLLGMSMLFRLISFIYFSFSWQWPNMFIRSIDVALAVAFLSMWLMYGFKHKVGFRKGLVIGLIGVSDGILLQVITLITYLFRGSHYFGPITMIPWVTPFLGVSDMFDFITDSTICLLPTIALILVTVGSYVGAKLNHGKLNA